MKTIKYIASLLAGITLFSCDNFEDINTNPDLSLYTHLTLPTIYSV